MEHNYQVLQKFIRTNRKHPHHTAHAPNQSIPPTRAVQYPTHTGDAPFADPPPPLFWSGSWCLHPASVLGGGGGTCGSQARVPTAARAPGGHRVTSELVGLVDRWPVLPCSRALFSGQLRSRCCWRDGWIAPTSPSARATDQGQCPRRPAVEFEMEGCSLVHGDVCGDHLLGVLNSVGQTWNRNKKRKR